jgi:murein DD-endopeptidase MepM/ murein hydrolase activator NlpD
MTAEEYVQQELRAGRLTAAHIVELVRWFQKGHALDDDGKPGAFTRAAIEASMDKKDRIAEWPRTPTLHSPMPKLPDGRKAVITSGFKTVNPSRPDHNGVDMFYTWKFGDRPDFVGDMGAAGRKANGEPKWVVPHGVRCVAAADGVVQIAGRIGTGYRMWIDHGNGWRTGYFHLLDTNNLAPGDVVYVGQQLGLVGDNPKDGDARHLHFELSPSDRYAPVDPEPYLEL